MGKRCDHIYDHIDHLLNLWWACKSARSKRGFHYPPLITVHYPLTTEY